MSDLGSQKFTLKLFAEPTSLPSMHSFIEVFHDWIKRRVLAEQMIDVTDYGHVPEGPLVFFCGHESDYVIDAADGRIGLFYRRKRAPIPSPSANGDAALSDGLSRLLAATAKLEAEPKLRGLKLGRGELSVGLVDRLRTPNDDATFERVAPILESTLTPVLGSVSLTRDNRDARRALTVVARAR